MPMNHIEYIINNLRLVYTKLYSDSGYLKKLDEGIISTISLQYEYVHFNREKGILKVKGDEEKIFSYPDIKEIIGESLPKLNENILYIIK